MATSNSNTSTSNITQQIVSILESEYPAPLHYKEITNRLIENEAWETLPKTPENTVSNRLSTDIKTKGDSATFKRVEPGVYTLNESNESSSTTTEFANLSDVDVDNFTTVNQFTPTQTATPGIFSRVTGFLFGSFFSSAVTGVVAAGLIYALFTYVI